MRENWWKKRCFVFWCLQLVLDLGRLAAAVISFQRLGSMLGDVFDEIVELSATLVLNGAVLRVLGYPEQGGEASDFVELRHVVCRGVELNNLYVFVDELVTYLSKSKFSKFVFLHKYTYIIYILFHLF